MTGKNIIFKYEDGLTLENGVTLNDWCWVNARYGVHIKRNTLIGPLVVIQSVNHVIKNTKREQNVEKKDRLKGEKIIIGEDVWIGARVIILPGVVIPDKCVIGAGTVLTKLKAASLQKGDIAFTEQTLKIKGNRRNYE